MFRFQSQDSCLREVGEVALVPDKLANSEDENGKFRQMMAHKAVHLLSLFLVIYIGVEVTIGGIISSLA